MKWNLTVCPTLARARAPALTGAQTSECVLESACFPFVECKLFFSNVCLFAPGVSGWEKFVFFMTRFSGNTTQHNRHTHIKRSPGAPRRVPFESECIINLCCSAAGQNGRRALLCAIASSPTPAKTHFNQV